jgi:hypothetical protein
MSSSANIPCVYQSPRPTTEPTDTQDARPFRLPREGLPFLTYFIPLIPLAIIDFWVYPHNKLAQGLLVLPPIIIAITNTIFAAHCRDNSPYLTFLLLSPTMNYM